MIKTQRTNSKEISLYSNLLRLTGVIVEIGILALVTWAASEMWDDPQYSKLGIILITISIFLFLLTHLFELITNKKIVLSILAKRFIAIAISIGMIFLTTLALLSMWMDPQHSTVKIIVIFIPVYVLLIGYLLKAFRDKI